MLKKLKVDDSKCVKCRQCIDICFTNVIELDEEKNRPYGKYPLDCQVCCVCEFACPTRAIEIVPDWDAKYYPPYISTLVKKSKEVIS